MSDRVKELRQKRGAAIDAADAILKKAEEEKRALSTEERAAWQAKVDEADALEDQIKVAERQAALNASLEGLTDDPPKNDPRSSPAIHTQEDRPYSLLRAIRAANSHSWADAKVERRASDELAEKRGEGPKHGLGFLVPWHALMPVDHPIAGYGTERKLNEDAKRELRDIGKVAPSTEGAGIVGVDYLPQEFIELLRTESATTRAGIRVLPNLIGDLKIGRQATGGSAGWVATEGGNVPESNLTTDSITASPKLVGIRQDVTRTMQLQSAPGVEDLIRADIRAGIGETIDLGVLDGTGASGQPTGILNTTGVGSVVTTGTLTWALIVEFETDVATAKGLRGRLAWVMRASIKGECKTTLKAASTSVYLMGEDGMMNGYPSFVSENSPASTLIFGNWQEAMLALWGVLELFPDPYTLADSGGLVVRGFQDCDVIVRHAESFSAAEDV